jgi:hypothetical protein
MLKVIALMLVSIPAMAGTNVPLQSPTVQQAYPTVNALQAPVLNPNGQQHACVAVGFNADDTVHGFCYTVTSGACSGRGCQPTYTFQFYDTNWSTDTTVISVVHCGQLVSHVPALTVWTYDPGYDATTCYRAPYPGTGPAQQVFTPYFGGSLQWEHYVSASIDGVWGLWNAFSTSWIGEF